VMELSQMGGTMTSDAASCAVDYLYSLIPLLDFQGETSPMLFADAMNLNRTELLALSEMLGTSESIFSAFLASPNLAVAPQPQQHQAPAKMGGEESNDANEDEDMARRITSSWLEVLARSLGTVFSLKFLQRPGMLSEPARAQLGVDADSLEKNIGSILMEDSKWDPILGHIRAFLLKQEAPREDPRYAVVADDAALVTLQVLLKAKAP